MPALKLLWGILQQAGRCKLSKKYPVQPHACCGAKTRSGGQCKNAPVTGKKKCRMHGGAFGSGAPLGNKNRLTHGFFTAEAVAERAWLRSLMKELKERGAALVQ
jgi:hypothetical protein